MKSLLKPIYYFILGLPPIDYNDITKTKIKSLVGKENPVILEIGCNSGQHTAMFLEIFEDPTIYCFEPDPRAVKRFKSHIGDHPKVRLFELAISDNDGETIFFQSGGTRDIENKKDYLEDWDLSGSIRRPKEHLAEYPWVKFEHQIKVQTLTLDSWCEQQNVHQIDFVWMDVQGAEVDVFNGAEKSLKNIRYLYTEYSNKELYEGQTTLKQILKKLSSYKVVTRYRNDVLLNNAKL